MNKCIELDPSFTKGYSRKAAVQFFMKEYDISPEEMKESQAKAMQDLDIQHIFPDHGFPRKPKGSKRYIR